MELFGSQQQITSFLTEVDHDYYLPEDADLLAEQYSKELRMTTLRDPLKMTLDELAKVDRLYALSLGIIRNKSYAPHLDIGLFTESMFAQGAGRRKMDLDLAMKPLENAEWDNPGWRSNGELTTSISYLNVDAQSIDQQLIRFKSGQIEEMFMFDIDPLELVSVARIGSRPQ